MAGGGGPAYLRGCNEAPPGAVPAGKSFPVTVPVTVTVTSEYLGTFDPLD
jgi:hypothetical protein